MRTDTTIRDVMHREFLGVSESDALADAAALLVEEETDCVVVLRGGEPVGRLRSRDALDALLNAEEVGGADDSGLTVGDAMRPPLPSVAPDDSLAAVEERLVAEGGDRVAVVADGEAVGVVAAGDVLAAGAPRTGSGADGLGSGPGPSAVRRERAMASAGTTADADAARGAEATLDPEPTAGETSGVTGARGAGNAPLAGGTTAPTDAPTQGVCENCGALVPDLVTANGQAVCPNCREI